MKGLLNGARAVATACAIVAAARAALAAARAALSTALALDAGPAVQRGDAQGGGRLAALAAVVAAAVTAVPVIINRTDFSPLHA